MSLPKMRTLPTHVGETDFQRIHLNAGESRTVTFKITSDLLKFYDYHLNDVIEPGDFDIMIGPNSRDVKKKRVSVLAFSAGS